MKKVMIIIGISIGGLVLLLLTARLTGIISWFSMPTPANEPALKVGGIYFGSNMITPKKGNLVVYVNRYTDSLNASMREEMSFSPQLYVKRLCGVGGDIVEMRNGILFVNDKNFDTAYNLKSNYKTTDSALFQAGYNLDSLTTHDPSSGIMITTHTFLVNLDDKEAASIKKVAPLERIIHDDTSSIFLWLGHQKGFTVDNFGPITVPPDCYFLFGDNRHNALDSRYVGFISKKDCKAVLFTK